MYEFSASSYLNKLLRLVLWAAHLPLLLGILWVVGLFFCRPLCALTLIPLLIILNHRIQRKKLRHVRTWIAFICMAEFGLYLCLPGPTEGPWQTGTARECAITVSANDTVHLTFIRDFTYHDSKKADIRYLEEDFDLKDITGVYLAECVRGKGLTDCSLMLSFAFRDGRYLVVSPEMRIPADEEENSLRKHYKNYGLFYLFGTEEDVFALHTDECHDYLSLFPLKADPAQAQAMLTLCLRKAVDAQSAHRAYHPLLQTYANDLLAALRLICPELSEDKPIHAANVAKMLYRNGATLISEKGDWSVIRRRYAVGYDIHPEERETYSDVIRERLGLPVRDTLPPRHEQDISTDPLLNRPASNTQTAKNKPAEAPLLISAPSLDDIPEPGDRLKNDSAKRESADTPQAPTQQQAPDTPREATDTPVEDAAEATRKLNEQESLLPEKPSVADGILEPGARMQADNRKEEEEEEAMQEAKKRAAEGRDLMEDREPKSKDGSNFNELFFGKRKSGITIIEKEKPKEEPHPLDPMRKQKRRNPFDDPQPKKDPQQEEDPFAPKAPIRIGG